MNPHKMTNPYRRVHENKRSWSQEITACATTMPADYRQKQRKAVGESPHFKPLMQSSCAGEAQSKEGRQR